MTRYKRFRKNNPMEKSKCAWCGRLEDLSVDHIHPKGKGGKNKEENLQWLCVDCNRLKGKLTLGQIRNIFRQLKRKGVFWDLLAEDIKEKEKELLSK